MRFLPPPLLVRFKWVLHWTCRQALNASPPCCTRCSTSVSFCAICTSAQLQSTLLYLLQHKRQFLRRLYQPLLVQQHQRRWIMDHRRSLDNRHRSLCNSVRQWEDVASSVDNTPRAFSSTRSPRLVLRPRIITNCSVTATVTQRVASVQ